MKAFCACAFRSTLSQTELFAIMGTQIKNLPVDLSYDYGTNEADRGTFTLCTKQGFLYILIISKTFCKYPKIYKNVHTSNKIPDLRIVFIQPFVFKKTKLKNMKRNISMIKRINLV